MVFIIIMETVCYLLQIKANQILEFPKFFNSCVNKIKNSDSCLSWIVFN